MTREDIINKEFSREFRGYDIKEVDAFLDEIAHELEKIEHEREIEKQRVAALVEELKRRGIIKDGAFGIKQPDVENKTEKTPDAG